MADRAPSPIYSLQPWQRRLANSRFFVISLFAHLLIVLWLGGTVLYQATVEPPDFTGDASQGFVSAPPPTEPPPSTQPQSPTFQVSTTPSTSSAPALSAITSTSTAQPSFTLPAIISPSLLNQPARLSLSSPSGGPAAGSGPPGSIPPAAAAGIAAFVQGWTRGNSAGPGTSLKAREFAFTAYLAKYEGGDWNSTVTLNNGQITGGSLPNLLYLIGKLSRDKIKAQPEAVPLDLSSQEIFAKKPPFIFLTGHRDFVLSDAEVANLQEYIKLGGCIWGDSSLPGRRSRFDLAFRREMRRVIPDKDKDFEPLPANDDLFTKAYYPEINQVPPGLNYYREPVYVMRYFGEIAILYTSNDYGDMWQIGLTERGDIDLRQNESGNYVSVNYGLWSHRGLYFRNLEAPALFDAYKFGTNIIVHLLTRWDDKLRTVPRGGL